MKRGTRQKVGIGGSTEYPERSDRSSEQYQPTKPNDTADLMADWEGVRKLSFAILERAVRDLVSNDSPTAKYQQHRRSAREFLLGTHSEPLSFIWICELFDLCPAYIRQSVFALAKGPGAGRMKDIRSGDVELTRCIRVLGDSDDSWDIRRVSRWVE